MVEKRPMGLGGQEDEGKEWSENERIGYSDL